MRKTPRALRTILDTNLEVFQNAKTNPWSLVDAEEDYTSMAELDNSEFRLRFFQEWKGLTMQIAKSPQYERWTKTPYVEVTFNNRLISPSEVRALVSIFKLMRTSELTTVCFWNPWTLTIETKRGETNP